MKRKICVHGVISIVAGVVGAALLASTAAAQHAPDNAEALAQETWRDAIAYTNVPAAGCFEASYPSLEWNKVECVEGPNVPFSPRSGRLSRQTVGAGNDYAAKARSGAIRQTVGSFPAVKGVTAEGGVAGANSYSLQLNSNFMDTKACDGAAYPADCRAWQQFVYSSDEKMAFMQHWLVFWNAACPAGWNSDGSSCYLDSKAVSVPKEKISTLKTVKLSGSAVPGGLDTLVMTVGKKAYSTTDEDSVVDLATAWTESEFNIFGDGGGVEADFNTGSSITVKIAVTNGTTNVVACASDSGTTGETNNLTLGDCTGKGGATPNIEFTESN
jgi:hypothetical protein